MISPNKNPIKIIIDKAFTPEVSEILKTSNHLIFLGFFKDRNNKTEHSPIKMIISLTSSQIRTV